MPGANRLYIAKSRLAAATPGGGGVLGPNLIGAPNGPFVSVPWSASNAGETAGQTDPLGGSTARLINDGVAAGNHYVFQNALNIVAGQKFLVTAFIKPGTYTSPHTIELFSSPGVGAVDFDPSTHVVSANASNTMSLSNLSSTAVANGFWKITFNVVNSNTNANAELDVSFGAGFPSYTGANNTFTLWGVSFQTST